MNDLIIAATDVSPEVAIHVNPTYALYQWLRARAEGPPRPLAAAFVEPVRLMRQAVNPGLNGIWRSWETGIVGGDGQGASLAGLRMAANTTVDQITQAVTLAEGAFLETIWPEQDIHLKSALASITVVFASVFPTIAEHHARLLKLRWPDRLNVYLIPESWSHAGAYSHPLTIAVNAHRGVELFETLVHEPTHVAEDFDDETSGPARIMNGLMSAGSSFPVAFNRWHAMIFASSAWQVRQHIDPNHVDYAISRGLYDRLGVANAVGTWRRYAEDGQDLDLLVASLTSVP